MKTILSLLLLSLTFSVTAAEKQRYVSLCCFKAFSKNAVYIHCDSQLPRAENQHRNPVAGCNDGEDYLAIVKTLQYKGLGRKHKPQDPTANSTPCLATAPWTLNNSEIDRATVALIDMGYEKNSCFSKNAQGEEVHDGARSEAKDVKGSPAIPVPKGPTGLGI